MSSAEDGAYERGGRLAGAFQACTLLFLVLTLPSWVQAGTCPEETRRAAAVRERIEREWPLRSADPVVHYIREFGRRLTERAGIGRSARWRFQVMRDYSVNAFSIGDGLIYLTEGAILIAADEAELAAILAHEMGHQLAGHFCPGPILGKERKPWWKILLSPTTPARSGAPARQDAQYGSLRRGIDPSKEHEADRLAADILRAADYDPLARMDLARRMARSAAADTTSEHLNRLAKTMLPPDRKQRHYPPQRSPELRRIQALLKKEQ